MCKQAGLRAIAHSLCWLCTSLHLWCTFARNTCTLSGPLLGLMRSRCCWRSTARHSTSWWRLQRSLQRRWEAKVGKASCRGDAETTAAPGRFWGAPALTILSGLLPSCPVPAVVCATPCLPQQKCHWFPSPPTKPLTHCMLRRLPCTRCPAGRVGLGQGWLCSTAEEHGSGPWWKPTHSGCSATESSGAHPARTGESIARAWPYAMQVLPQGMGVLDGQVAKAVGSAHGVASMLLKSSRT